MMRAALLLLPLAACGPVPLYMAEDQCFEQARLAQQPRGEIALGIGSDGSSRARVKLGISSDYIMGRDPSAVYDSCVYQKSGQPPSRPLYSRTDWKG
ncbi:MAG: hypothetical protein U1D06_12120 [Paracoccaceae bacterium]|nr:hypothetical protein [Paracoccaceae bacterium]